MIVLELSKFQKKLENSLEIIASIYRVQAYDSIMCAHFCIVVIDFMLKGKSLLDYTNLFSPNDYEKKKDKIILKYFQYLKIYCVICGKYRTFENVKPKISYL